jgi:hypothetical protein
MIPVKPQLSKSTCPICLCNTSTENCCFFYSHSKKDNINANILNHLKTHPDKICYNCIKKIITNECEYFKCPFCREEISIDHIIIDVKQNEESKCSFKTKNKICFGLIIILVTILWFFLGLITCWLTNDNGEFNPNCIMIGLTAAIIPTLFYYNRKKKFHWCKNCGFSLYVGLVFGFAIAIRSINHFEGMYLFYSFIVFMVTFFSLLLCTQL